jgi:hypothetical protein
MKLPPCSEIVLPENNMRKQRLRASRLTKFFADLKKHPPGALTARNC